jgi:cell division protein FtsN
MEETRAFEPGRPNDPERTVVQPRFDVTEEQTARPVVPLAEVRRRRVPRSALPLALLVVSALVGGLVSVLAYRLYQQRQQGRAARPVVAAATAPTSDQPTPPPTQAAPASVAVSTTTPEPKTSAPAAARAETEVASAEPERVVRERREDDERRREEDERARAVARRDEEARRAAREQQPPQPQPRARRVDVIPAGPVPEARGERVGREEASDYELPADASERRQQRRAKRRSANRIRDIFEGPPPGGER